MAEFAIETVESHPIVAVHRKVKVDSAVIARAMQEDFQTLAQFFADTGVHPIGPPLSIYTAGSGGETEYDLGFPVSPSDQAKAAGAVVAGQTPSGKVLRTTHQGAYDKLMESYVAADAEIKRQGLRHDGPMWEVYVTDPGMVAENELLTELFFRVA